MTGIWLTSILAPSYENRHLCSFRFFLDENSNKQCEHFKLPPYLLPAELLRDLFPVAGDTIPDEEDIVDGDDCEDWGVTGRVGGAPGDGTDVKRELDGDCDLVDGREPAEGDDCGCGDDPAIEESEELPLLIFDVRLWETWWAALSWRVQLPGVANTS